MPANKSNIKERIRKIITGGLGQEDDIEVRRKTILFNIVCIIGIISMIPFGILAFISDEYILAAINVTTTIVLFMVFFYLRRTGYHIFLSYLGLSFGGVLFFYLFVTGGINNTGYIWYFIFPLVALFLLGSKKGAIATSLLFILALLVFTLEGHASFVTSYPISFEIRFIPTFLIVFSLSYFFESIRESTQKQLIKKNIALREIINELKQTEDALRESETRLKATLESTADGILVVNELGEVVATNLRFSEMWRIPDEILKSNDDSKLLDYVLEQLIKPDEFLSKVQKLYKSAKKDLDILYFRDGRVFERYSEPLILETNIKGRVWSFRDITERREAEKEKAKLQARLQRAQKMEAIGTLAGGVAHDLNNILSGIVTYPDLLLTQLPENSFLRKPISTIRDSGNKAAAIVQDLLTLARRGVAAKEVINLNEIISEYLKSPEYERLKSFHPHVEVKTDLAEDPLNMLGSPVHLSKTVMNLVSNAAESITESGNILLSTENRYIDKPLKGYDDVEEGDYVTLVVSDSGVGMTPEIIDRIFDPFFTKKKMGRSGTGLGMSVVWGTVKDHNGYIDIESTEGSGSTFIIYFPTSRQKIRSEKLMDPIDVYKGKGESILVVDDIKEQREIASSILKVLGYTVTTVPSGEQAIQFMERNSVDLLILDMIMEPGIDGLETYENIIKLHPGQKAIIASGFSETDRIKEAQRLGVGNILKKPYTLEGIGVKIKEELEK